MKNLFVSLLLAISFYSCGGSGKVTVEELLHIPSFNSDEFLKSKISIYSPYVISYPGFKYPDISENDLTDVVLNQARTKLVTKFNNQNIKIENKKAPDFFRGIKIIKGEGEELLKNTNSDYFLIINSVIIGNETSKPNANLNSTIPVELQNPNPPQKTVMDKEKYSTKHTTQTTITYDIWDVKKGVSVYTSEASIVLTDGLNHKNPYASIEKVTEALIDKIVGDEE